jgi:hypothetical protein
VRIVRCELAKQFLSIDRAVTKLLLSISHLTGGVPVVFPSLSMRNVLPPPPPLQPHVLTHYLGCSANHLRIPMTQFVVFLCCSTCICVGAWRTVAGVVVPCPNVSKALRNVWKHYLVDTALQPQHILSDHPKCRICSLQLSFRHHNG